ncbi:MAG: PHP domain-containing protein [Clostridia bacterium]|nr:PHP domain-containing protein [Clostridia bacterium]
MLQDLHSHTYYSFCGKDTPEAVVEAAIAGGIELLGITDHCHGIGNARLDVFFSQSNTLGREYGRTLRRYFDHINLIREKYAEKIKVVRGIELTLADHNARTEFPLGEDISYFDYCLIENPDQTPDIDIFRYQEAVKCPMGVAHTDLFAYAKDKGVEPYRLFGEMAKAGIFWEMNVSYDSIHSYREHPYMLRFFEDPEQQAIVRESGLRLSVGFDGHRVEDYLPERIKDYCRSITAMGIKLQFE